MARRRQSSKRGALARLGDPGPWAGAGGLIERFVIDPVPLGQRCQAPWVVDPGSLQQELLAATRMHDGSSPADVAEAIDRVHGADNHGLPESVVLAATHRCLWVGVTDLMRRLTGAAVVGDDLARRLAESVMDEDAMMLTVPGSMLVDSYSVITRDVLREVDARRSYPMRRLIPPQLRRWAAGRYLAQGAEVALLVQRAQDLDSHHGPAVLLGMLDVTGEVDEQVRDDVRSTALASPHSGVRLAALKQLPAAGGHERTVERLAAEDPAASVRDWAAAHLRKEQERVAREQNFLFDL